MNLFYGFINAPEDQDISKNYIDSKGASQSVNSSVQKATHIVGGFEFDLFKYFEVNIETIKKISIKLLMLIVRKYLTITI